MTDTPDSQSGAPAGDKTPERAELLGTAALTARVRCPCGKRQDVGREDWEWFGVTVCPRCGRGILDHSLRVVDAEEARSMIEARRPTEGELRSLRRMELALRDFLPRYDHHPRWYWSPPTARLAEEVRRVLSDLDESRRGRGAPPVVVTPDVDEDEDEDGEGEGRRDEVDDDEGFEDEEFEGDDSDEDTSAGGDE